MTDAWHVYILECADATLYTGIARDIEKRLRQHNGEAEGGPKYTRGRQPVRLVWCDVAPDRGAALRREAAIKKMSRVQKHRLIVAGELARSSGGFSISPLPGCGTTRYSRNN